MKLNGGNWYACVLWNTRNNFAFDHNLRDFFIRSSVLFENSFVNQAADTSVNKLISWMQQHSHRRHHLILLRLEYCNSTATTKKVYTFDRIATEAVVLAQQQNAIMNNWSASQFDGLTTTHNGKHLHTHSQLVGFTCTKFIFVSLFSLSSSLYFAHTSNVRAALGRWLEANIAKWTSIRSNNT